MDILYLAIGLVDHSNGLSGEGLATILREHGHHGVQDNIGLRPTYIHGVQ